MVWRIIEAPPKSLGELDEVIVEWKAEVDRVDTTGQTDLPESSSSCWSIFDPLEEVAEEAPPGRQVQSEGPPRPAKENIYVVTRSPRGS